MRHRMRQVRAHRLQGADAARCGLRLLRGRVSGVCRPSACLLDSKPQVPLLVVGSLRHAIVARPLEHISKVRLSS